MPCDKRQLIEFLEVVDDELNEEIVLVAVGGTAMTLLDLKRSTIDIDFTIPRQYDQPFQAALKRISHGFKIDTWVDGMVFSQMLPEDYIDKSISIPTHLKQIHVKALHPLDIVCTKIGRLNERDIQDIGDCIKKFYLSKEQIQQRAHAIEYVGQERIYLQNLTYVLDKYF